MTYAILYDTGFGNAAVTGTQLANASRAGVNSAEDTVFGFGMDITVETINGGGSVQNDEEIRNDTSLSSVSPITFNNPVIVLNCSIPSDQIDDTNYKYSWLYQLMQMERTKGVKIIAMKQNGASGAYSYNRVETLPEMYGKRYLDEPTKTIVASLTGYTEGTVPHLVGYVENISNIINSANSDHIKFTVTFRLIEDLS